MPRRLLVLLGVLPLLVAGAPAPSEVATAASTAEPTAEPSVEPSGESAEQRSVELAPVLEPLLGADPSPGVSPGAVEGALQPFAGDDRLGGRIGLSVVDVGSGSTLFEVDATRGMAPASSLKLLTAAAALEVLGPDHTVRTTVVGPDLSSDDAAADTTATPATPGAAPGASPAASPGTGPPTPPTIVLVGGGDPLLSATSDGDPTRTSLTGIAADAAATLTEAGVDRVRLQVDDSAFTGPAIDLDWDRRYVPNGVAGPVSALSLDGGRVSPGVRTRVPDPALAAGDRFAELLTDEGLDVVGDVERGAAPEAGVEYAGADSATIGTIVEQVDLRSDNDGAETLLRLVGIGPDGAGDGSADAGVTAVREVATALGADPEQVRPLDGSGLARGSRVSARALARVVATAAEPDRPALRPVLTGLPVAGGTGTLQSRFQLPAAAPGRGLVRAKTGTLSGITSLTGTVQTRSGDLLAVSFLADRIQNPLDARAAMDAALAELSTL